MIFEKELIGNIMPFAHAANALELPDGRVFVAWYCGSYEGSEDQRIAGAVRHPDGAWDPARVVVDRFAFEGELWNPETSVPVLTSDGEIHLFFFAYPRSRLRLVQDIRSHFVKPHRAGFNCTPRQVEQPLWYRDLMVTRLFTTQLEEFANTALIAMPLDRGAVVFQGRALHLRTGEVVLPYHRRQGTEMRSAQVFAGFLIGDGNLEHWQFGAEMFKDPGCSEPSIVQLPSGEVLCYMRRPGLTRTPPPPPGHAWRAVSTDGCRSFSEPEQTNLRNPDSGMDIYLGRGDRLVAAYNDSYAERFPLCVGISDDFGATFRMRDVESHLGAHSYPKLLQTRDGLWHVFYSHNYAAIGHAWFDDEWLEGGRRMLG